MRRLLEQTCLAGRRCCRHVQKHTLENKLFACKIGQRFPDGRHVTFVSDREGHRDISLLLANQTGQVLIHATFSPDGQWFAYMSSESGTGQVFVQPFPTTGAKYQISTERGRAPVWSQDGKQIIYHSPITNKFTVIDVQD